MKITRQQLKKLVREELLREEKKYDIGSVWMNDGMTIFNRAEQEDDNFKRIAHIDKKGNLKTFESLPSDIEKMFKIWADSIKKGNRPGPYEGIFLGFKSPLIEKDPKGWSKEDQLLDDLVSAYKWAFGKVWDKAKKLPPNDPEYKKLIEKMKGLSDEIDKLVKKQHQKEAKYMQPGDRLGPDELDTIG